MIGFVPKLHKIIDILHERVEFILILMNLHEIVGQVQYDGFYLFEDLRCVICESAAKR